MEKRSRAEIERRIANHTCAKRFRRTRITFTITGIAAELGASSEPLPPLVFVSESEVAAVRTRFNLRVAASLCPESGAEYGPAKRWPAESFVEAPSSCTATLRVIGWCWAASVTRSRA